MTRPWQHRHNPFHRKVKLKKVPIENWSEKDIKRLMDKVYEGTLPPHRLDLGPCWENTYSVEGNGYKQMRLHGRLIMIHRFVWVLHFGPIEDGLDINHLCTNRGCCRIEHLEKITRKEHLHKTDVFKVYLLHAAKTSCPHGHPYSADNTYYWKNQRTGLVGRKCRECHRTKVRAAQRAKKQAA